MRISKFSLILIIFIVVVIFIILIFNFFKINKSSRKSLISEASSQSSTLNSTDDWDAGSKTNILSTSGNISINVKTVTESEIDLMAIYNADNSSVTVSINEADKAKPLDGNDSTYWQGPNLNDYWQIDLGSVRTISKRGEYTTGGHLYCYRSVNGTDWTNDGACHAGSYGETTYGSPVSVRYYKIAADAAYPTHTVKTFRLWENSSATATHTSGATQITNTNLYQWQTFKPTYTYDGTPANTTIQFKFRTSTNTDDQCTTWNSWTEYQTIASDNPFDLTSPSFGLKSYSGTEADPGTFYKCLQVETKMTSSDGSSTPVLDKYEIGYHTNVKPNAPTAQSVTVGG